jgi:hypothetical protein
VNTPGIPLAQLSTQHGLRQPIENPTVRSSLVFFYWLFLRIKSVFVLYYFLASSSAAAYCKTKRHASLPTNQPTQPPFHLARPGLCCVWPAIRAASHQGSQLAVLLVITRIRAASYQRGQLPGQISTPQWPMDGFRVAQTALAKNKLGSRPPGRPRQHEVKKNKGQANCKTQNLGPVSPFDLARLLIAPAGAYKRRLPLSPLTSGTGPSFTLPHRHHSLPRRHHSQLST